MLSGKEMAEEATKQINKAREELAAKMLEGGHNPSEWAIADNMEEFIEDIGNKNNSYMCWAIKKHTGAKNG